jgi:hypothetical protein
LLLYKPRVFISHSAKEKPAQILCEAIAKGLAAADFDVLWDKELPDSAPWRGAVDEWIWNCDAAVLVLSEHAVNSKYVAYEATHLRQRWLHMKPNFVLLPIWCPGVNEQVLVQCMGAVQIAEIHTNVKLAAWPDEKDEAAYNSQAQQVVEKLAAVRQQSQPRHEIEELLILNLDAGTPNDAALEKIATAYGLPPLSPGAKKDRAFLLARLLLDSKECLGSDRFDRLKSGIPKMMAVLESADDRTPRIVKLVAPFCWVSPDRVARIPFLLSNPVGGVRAIAWVRRWPLSEHMYLYRAFCSRTKVHVVSPSDLSGGANQATFDHVLVCLAGKVCYDPNASAAAVAKRIKKLSQSGERVFLNLHADVVANELLTQVCLSWPDLCVFLHSSKLNAQQLSVQFPAAHVIEPALTEDEETDARIGWGDCIVAAGWKAERSQIVEEFES